jgi:hypothetical protein
MILEGGEKTGTMGSGISLSFVIYYLFSLWCPVFEDRTAHHRKKKLLD